jgi:ParB family chromosome partitioning protein
MSTEKTTIGAGIDSLFGDTGNPNEYETMVNLDDIEIEAQVREEFENDNHDLAGLGRSLRDRQLHAIVIRLNRPGREKPYLLVAGERRCRGARIEGLTQLRARVMELDDEQAEEAQFIENIHHKNLTQIEEAKKVQRDLDLLGSVEMVLEKHHKGRAWLSKILSLLTLPDQAKRLIAEDISSDIEVINTVKTIANINPDAADALVDDLKATRGKENARVKAGAVKDAVKPPKPPKPPKKDKEKKDTEQATGNKPESASFAGAKNTDDDTDNFVELPAINPEEALKNAYSAIVEHGNPQKAIDSFSGDEKEAVKQWLESFYDAGTQARNIERYILQGLIKGPFATFGPGAFALAAFLQGVDREARFSLLNIFASVKA